LDQGILPSANCSVLLGRSFLCAMARLLLAAAEIAAVVSLNVHDAPSSDALSRTGIATVLDPELTNAALEKFHVTTPGEHAVIVLPENADLENPAAADLIVYATFGKLTDDPCEDLLIRTVTFEGSSVGTNVTKLVFNVGSDNFNDTAAHEYTYTFTDSGGNPQEVTNTDARHLFDNVPICYMGTPRGVIREPTYRTYMHRQRIMQVECSLNSLSRGHDIKVYWSTVWRGFNSTTNSSIFANDLSFSIGNVANAGGILGSDDHSAISAAIPGCNKKQPVLGPYQTRKGKPRGKPWKRAHHFR